MSQAGTHAMRPSMTPPRRTLSESDQLQLSQHVALALESVGDESSSWGRVIEAQSTVHGSAASEVHRRLEQGQPLAQAMTDGDTPTARSLAATVEAGLAANQLGRLLRGWCDVQAARRQAWADGAIQLAYPLLLLVLCPAAIGWTAYQLIPDYLAAYEMMNRPPPAWMAWLNAYRSWIPAIVAATCGVSLLPAAWLIWRGSGYRADGWPRHRGRALSLEAHGARVAAAMLERSMPLDAIRTASQAVTGSLQSPQPPMTDRILVAVQRQALPIDEAIDLLQQRAASLDEQSAFHGSRLARQAPWWISLGVGLSLLIAYVGLVYWPWVELLTKMGLPHSTGTT